MCARARARVCVCVCVCKERERKKKGERDEDRKRPKGYKHEAVTGYSWVPARTIIDKIELRAAEHRDSGRSALTPGFAETLFVRKRQSSTAIGSCPIFNAPRFTNARTRMLRIETRIIFGARGPLSEIIPRVSRRERERERERDFCLVAVIPP